MPAKKAALRLFRKADLAASSANLRGEPLVGWKPISEGSGFANKRGFALVRVVTQQLVNDTLRDMYDQFKFFENPGSVVIILNGEGDNEKVCLVENFRFIGPRFPMDNLSKYIAYIDENRIWTELVQRLGNTYWEAPRGLIPSTDTPKSLEELVLQTAKIEAFEEAGIHIKDLRIAGEFNPNSTFFAHTDYVVTARIDRQEDQHPESLELLGGVRFFSKQEVRAMVNRGEFVDGIALSAMAIAGFHF